MERRHLIMARDDDLLPSNATALERELARLSGRVEDIPLAEIETIWDASRCPAHLLGRLAAELSIDFWRDEWPEATQRSMIAAAPEYHAIKGTPRAIEIALLFLGYTVRVVPWSALKPARRRGTFVVRLLITDPANYGAIIDQADTAAIQEAVRRAKPKSRGYAIQIGVGFKHAAGAFAVGRVIAASRVNAEAGRPSDFEQAGGAVAVARFVALSRTVGIAERPSNFGLTGTAFVVARSIACSRLVGD